MRSDPSDNGGLFVGRRPGTQPVHYREAPVFGDARQRRRDSVLAAAILALMVVINLSLWGPIPAGWLWIVSHIPFLAERVFLAVIVVLVGILLTLVGALSILKQLDRAWVLVRRAAGYDQREGVVGRVFAYTAFVGVTIFGLWMVFGGGLAQMGEGGTPTPP
ncbi:MAG: hypothetical protein ACKOB9_08095 [Solirubrobacterales bacterium]